jgi:hypothetical protein
MGREIREVPADWQHPTEWKPGKYWPAIAPYAEREFVPLHDFDEYTTGEYREGSIVDWMEEEGFTREEAEARHDSDVVDYGDRPRTHVQLYETVSEGTPVSPVFATRDELAAWLTEVFEMDPATASRFVNAGYAPSFIVSSSGMQSGMEAF